MTTLHLTLKKKWFDLILSGEKKEEYREIKDYWAKRLVEPMFHRMETYLTPDFYDEEMNPYCFKKFDAIQFTNGYSATSPSFIIECKSIKFGKGKSEWGAPDEQVFIISLGKILERKNTPHDTSHS